jgi:hypothetical protein
MSKKYKTSEAIAMLEQNPRLRFNCVANGVPGELRVGVNGAISYIDNLAIYNQWELIQQSVDFLTAVKAYSEGKTIRCEFIGYNGKKYTAIYDDKKENSKYNQLVDNNSDIVSDPVCCEEILNGTWYVEE